MERFILELYRISQVAESRSRILEQTNTGIDLCIDVLYAKESCQSKRHAVTCIIE